MMLFSRTRSAVPALIAGMLAISLHAQNLNDLLGGLKHSAPSGNVAGLSEDQIGSGLKEALAKGVQTAVTGLGHPGGFLNDLAVRIPLPGELEKAEKVLHTIGEGKLADNFVASMNAAAEQAVPEAAGVLGDAIRQMTLADAKAILVATNNAATAYFRKTSEASLQTRLLPIVQKATDKVGVTKAYKDMMGKVNLGGLGGLSSLGHFGGSAPTADNFDVDKYVTGKALDGLFVKIGDQEKQIRSNPAARTTSLLQEVFGAAGK